MLQLVGVRAFVAVAVVFGLAVVVGIYMVDAQCQELGIGRQISLVLTGATAFNVILGMAFRYGWRCLWRRFPSLNDRLFPDWNGTWDVEIHSQWKEEPVYAKAEIKQDLLKVSISLQAERSDSDTLSVVPKKHPESSRPHLHYLYEARPTQGYQDDDLPHMGAAILRPDLNNNDVLRGSYFTNRPTSGHYVMTRVPSSR